MTATPATVTPTRPDTTSAGCTVGGRSQAPISQRSSAAPTMMVTIESTRLHIATTISSSSARRGAARRAE